MDLVLLYTNTYYADFFKNIRDLYLCFYNRLSPKEYRVFLYGQSPYY
jgi:hypothetical protein